MGVPSLTIMLHEIIKLLKYSGADDPIIIRLGTSGGLGKSFALVFSASCWLFTDAGVPAGTIVITNKAYNSFCEEFHEIVSSLSILLLKAPKMIS